MVAAQGASRRLGLEPAVVAAATSGQLLTIRQLGWLLQEEVEGLVWTAQETTVEPVEGLSVRLAMEDLASAVVSPRRFVQMITQEDLASVGKVLAGVAEAVVVTMVAAEAAPKAAEVALHFPLALTRPTLKDTKLETVTSL